MSKLILEYRHGDSVTRLERTIERPDDEVGVYNTRRHHLTATLTNAGQQLVNGAGLPIGGGEDPAQQLLAAFQEAAENANVNLPDRFLLTLADIAVADLPLIR